jgi:hypothetical protein
VRFDVYTAKELIEKFPSNGEPPHLCPLIGVIKEKTKSPFIQNALCELQEIGHDLRLWGRSYKGRTEKAEAECKRLRGLADIAIVAMQNGDFKKAETHLMPMLIRLEI